MLTSPPAVIIDRQWIAARKCECTYRNSMHLFLFVSYVSLNNLAFQLFVWLRIFISVRSKLWLVSTKRDAMRDTFT